jgi:hypothetical protein
MRFLLNLLFSDAEIVCASWEGLPEIIVGE